MQRDSVRFHRARHADAQPEFVFGIVNLRCQLRASFVDATRNQRIERVMGIISIIAHLCLIGHCIVIGQQTESDRVQLNAVYNHRIDFHPPV